MKTVQHTDCGTIAFQSAITGFYKPGAIVSAHHISLDTVNVFLGGHSNSIDFMPTVKLLESISCCVSTLWETICCS